MYRTMPVCMSRDRIGSGAVTLHLPRAVVVILCGVVIVQLFAGFREGLAGIVSVADWFLVVEALLVFLIYRDRVTYRSLIPASTMSEV